MIRMEHLFHEEMLRESGLSSLERRSLGVKYVWPSST